MKYLVSDVESWGKQLDAMPAPDPGRRKVGKKEAVFLLAKKLQAAARRGFSTAELLEALASMGLNVHVDTVRAALKRVGKGAVTRPRGSQRNAGPAKGLLDVSDYEPGPTSGWSNAGMSGGDEPVSRAETDLEGSLTTGRGAVGISAEGESEKTSTLGRSNSGASTAVRSDADVGVGAQRDLAWGRGRNGDAAESETAKDAPVDRSQTPDSDATEPEDGPASGATAVATAALEESGAGPVSAGASDQGRERRPSVDDPGKDTAEAPGRGARAPTSVAHVGHASSSREPERRAPVVVPARGSFTPREDSDEI